MFSIILTGDKRLARKFDRMAYGSSKKIVAPAITKGLAVIRKAAREKVQVKSGLTKKSLGSKVKIYGRDSVFAAVGPRKGFPGEPGLRVHLLELGTATSKAFPFLRPALDENKARALKVIAAVAKLRLNAEARKR